MIEIPLTILFCCLVVAIYSLRWTDDELRRNPKLFPILPIVGIIVLGSTIWIAILMDRLRAKP